MIDRISPSEPSQTSVRGSSVGPPLAILAAMVACVAASRTGWLFARPFWRDEFHTFFVVTDPGLGHSLRALRDGADFNPPGLFLLLRAVAAISGTPSEVSLRGFAFASVFVGLVGVYRLLRDRFTAPVAMAGTLATWAHPMMIHHAFEARFYGPWFAASVWLCLALNRLGAARRTAGPAIVVAGLSVFLCSLHYFGIISVALIAASHLIFAPRRPGQRRQTLLALAAGPVALAVLLPIFYPGQRASLSVPTWIEPPNPAQVRAFLAILFPAAPFALPAAVVAVAAMIRRRSPGVVRVSFEDVSLGPLAGAMGLALMPAAIIAVSYLLQPSMVDRYAIAALVCVGPIVATTVERAGRGVALLSCVALLGLATLGLRDEARTPRYAEANDALPAIEAIRAEGPGPALVVSDLRDLSYQCWRAAPELRPRLRLLDLAGEAQEANPTYRRVERDVATRLARLFDVPGVATPDEARRGDVVYVLAAAGDADRLAALFPWHHRSDLYAAKVVAMKLTTAPMSVTLAPDRIGEKLESGRRESR